MGVKLELLSALLVPAVCGDVYDHSDSIKVHYSSTLACCPKGAGTEQCGYLKQRTLSAQDESMHYLVAGCDCQLLPVSIKGHRGNRSP